MALALFAQFLTWPVVARRIRREHATIDAEHGVNHDDWFFEPFDADTDDDPDAPIEYHPTNRGETRG